MYSIQFASLIANKTTDSLADWLLDNSEVAIIAINNWQVNINNLPFGKSLINDLDEKLTNAIFILQAKLESVDFEVDCWLGVNSDGEVEMTEQYWNVQNVVKAYNLAALAVA